MTAIAHQPHTPHRHINWAELRREYDGGAGLNLRELAQKYGLPSGTVFCRAAAEQWRQDKPALPDQAAVTARLHALLGTRGEIKPPRIRETLEREFGANHPALPSLQQIRKLFPKVGQREVIVPLVPIDGLTRRCYGPECFQITTHDPCHHCGTPAT